MGAILRWRYGQLALVSTAAAASKAPAARITKWAQSGASCQILRALRWILPRPILSRLSLFDGNVSGPCGDMWVGAIRERVRSCQRKLLLSRRNLRCYEGKSACKGCPAIHVTRPAHMKKGPKEDLPFIFCLIRIGRS